MMIFSGLSGFDDILAVAVGVDSSGHDQFSGLGLGQPTRAVPSKIRKTGKTSFFINVKNCCEKVKNLLSKFNYCGQKIFPLLG
jgi:hypothetical protein